MSLITLITDFGTHDHYVASMKGVIYQIAPRATVVDISHDVEPHNVLHAAFVLRHAWPWFPPGTVHLAVVDSGVGSSRRILVGHYGGQYVVAPDNGIVTLVHHELPLLALHVAENVRHFLASVSMTFQGRDVMAPLAAKLSEGMRISDVGPRTDRVEVLPLARPKCLPHHETVGEVLFIDRFGNLLTNIGRADLAPTFRVRHNVQVYLDETCVGPIRSCYGDVSPGEALALIGSTDHLEIAVNQGSAAGVLRSGRGAVVHVR